MNISPFFPEVFLHLRAILQPYAKALTVAIDTAEAYSLEGPYSKKWKKPIFFGSTVIKKNYVSFYLMPVYIYPELLKEISPGLKKHMQGLSTVHRSDSTTVFNANVTN